MDRRAHLAVVAETDEYQTLRQRFIDHFYFSGRVAVQVAPHLNGDQITFADQTIYMGLALLVFASEMALLRRAGADFSDARSRVKELLDGIAVLETLGNERFGSSDTAPNGLFVRDDITGPNDARLGRRFHTVTSDWQNPAQENSSPSGDQVFGLMMGLYGVVALSGDSDLTQQAKATSSRLFDYARRTDFILRLPNGIATRRGSDMRWLSFLANGLNKAITGIDLFPECRINVDGFRIPLNGIGAFWSDPRTPQVISALTGQVLHVPIIGNDVEINSFALHLLLMALSPSEVWSQADLERVALRANHHLSAMLYADAHATVPASFNSAVVDAILTACPETGPQSSLSPTTGWGHDNRWIRCTDIFQPNGDVDSYSGVDWLLLRNLQQLLFGGTIA
jgi:hypothetical protein